VSVFGTIDELEQRLGQARYFADRSLATTLFLALRLERPLLLEGEAGVGKTEIARTLADVLARPLIRLQCYEGLDVHSAVYEWDYSRQLLHIRLLEAAGPVGTDAARRDLFGPSFLLKRPLLQAIDPDAGTDAGAPILLIDELDRADEEFEAFLLELLADFQVTVPEIGTIRATRRPIVIITSNRTRDIHDALRRRCLYHWIDYPDFQKEYRIVCARVPGAADTLAREAVAFVQDLRTSDLFKKPGVAETLDWVNALVNLNQRVLSPEVVDATLGALLKYQDDVQLARSGAAARALSTATTAQAGHR
jgi:MoxR-like ATPase